MVYLFHLSFSGLLFEPINVLIERLEEEKLKKVPLFYKIKIIYIIWIVFDDLRSTQSSNTGNYMLPFLQTMKMNLEEEL